MSVERQAYRGARMCHTCVPRTRVHISQSLRICVHEHVGRAIGLKGLYMCHIHKAFMCVTHCHTGARDASISHGQVHQQANTPKTKTQMYRKSKNTCTANKNTSSCIHTPRPAEDMRMHRAVCLCACTEQFVYAHAQSSHRVERLYMCHT